MGSPTEFLTLSTSDWPSDAAVCSLSDVLEATGDVPPRFYLSARACAGILRRAALRQKVLPAMLRSALQAVADASPELMEASFHKDVAGKSRRRSTPPSEASSA
jgi:hypothetical protein